MQGAPSSPPEEALVVLAVGVRVAVDGVVRRGPALPVELPTRPTQEHVHGLLPRRSHRRHREGGVAKEAW